MIVLLTASLIVAGGGLLSGSPTPALLWTLSQAGIGLLIAYSIAIAGVEKSLGRKGTRDRHEDWLGVVAGCGVCGLVGIAAAMGTAAHLEAGHDGFADEVGLWSAVASLGMLGIVVAILPIISYEWRRDR
jgi:hypothetical protein